MLALAVALVMMQGTSRDVPETCDIRAGVITDSAIGPFRVGESVTALRRRCPFVRDTAYWVQSEFQDTVHALVSAVRGVPVLIYYQDDKVETVAVRHPGLATRDGIRVGSSIARFRSMRGVEVSVSDYGPGVTLTVAAHCGLFFDLSGWGQAPPQTAEEPLRVLHHELDAWPSAIEVIGISVVSGLCKR